MIITMARAFLPAPILYEKAIVYAAVGGVGLAP